MIKYENGKLRYFDRNGVEITEGCKIRYESGELKTVYLGESGDLGIDATNPRWIEMGRAVPCEFGLYPLESADTNEVVVVTE